ncbi:MAG: glycosyltransferase [Phycisphaerae bacterium]
MQLAAIPSIHDSLAFSIWFYLMAVIGLIWLRRHFDLNKGGREPILQENEPGTPFEQLPKLSMLVAGKDEAANIGRCIEGLLRQQYPNLQVIIINDRSTDRTGPIIDECAAKDPRLAAVHIKDLPAGWFGKNNAMAHGVKQATGEWLCFSDADCAYDSPHLLAAAVRLAQREKLGFLSVLPKLEAGTVWERIVQPVAGAIMVFWYPPQKVNSDRYPHAYANGAFMLLSREAYDKLGGHEPVKATLNEDMHLARRAKQVGVRLRVIRGDTLYRVRMYVGLGQIWRGWSRIFYGCLGTFPRLLGSVAMLTFFSVGPWATLLASPIAGPHAPWIAAAGAWAVLGQQSVMWRFYSLTRNGAAWAVTYPIGAALCVAMTINAMNRLRGATTTWRGTAYKGGA